METDTKAMSLQECEEIVSKKHFPNGKGTLVIGHKPSLFREAAELYKDSCLAAQKSELKTKIESLFGDHLPEDYKRGLDRAIGIIEKS